MLSDCLKCRKNTESQIPKSVGTKNRKIMLLSKCAVRNSKKSKFLKEQEARGLLSNLTVLKITFLGDLQILKDIFQKYKMNASNLTVLKITFLGD